MKRPCQCCGGEKPEWERMAFGPHFRRCSICRGYSFCNLPEPWDPGRVYGEDYFEQKEYLAYVRHRPIHMLNFSQKWARVRPWLAGPVSVVEIGCACGFFGEFLSRRENGKYFGIDVSKYAIDLANQVVAGTVVCSAEPVLPPWPFNVLVAWDVFEHLAYPADYVAFMVNALQPGGIIALSTVDSGAPIARLRGARWRQLHPPTHLHYPTKKSLELLMKRLHCIPLENLTYGYFRALETYLAALKFKVTLLPKALRLLPVRLDLGDIQLMIARKTNH